MTDGHDHRPAGAWSPADTKASKFLSLVLRHAPERAGITLDAAGWTPIGALLEGAAANGMAMSRERLDRIVATNPKQRFVIDETGTLIRAAQGHSVEVELGYEPATPPAVLFHGTHPAVVDAILQEGLRPMKRRHVHLSADEATASTVGARRGKPVILRVDSAAMHAAGHEFWLATNGVWLAAAVAPQFVAGPDR